MSHDLGEDSTWVKEPLTELLVRHGLATRGQNLGLTMVQTKLGGYQAQLQAHRLAYGATPGFSPRILFGAHSQHSQVKVVNFVISDMPFLKNEARRLMREHPGVSPVGTLEALDRFLALISRHLADRAAEHGLPAGVESKISLLNLIVARSTNRLANTLGTDRSMPQVEIDWLLQGVSVELVLHFFSAAAGGGYDRRARKPLATPTEALELSGVPLRQVRLLYGNNS